MHKKKNTFVQLATTRRREFYVLAEFKPTWFFQKICKHTPQFCI